MLETIKEIEELANSLIPKVDLHEKISRKAHSIWLNNKRDGRYTCSEKELEVWCWLKAEEIIKSEF